MMTLESSEDAYFNELTILGWMSPDEYHNAVVGEKRSGGRSDKAYDKAVEGLRHYPYDIDLLADAIQYAPVGVRSKWVFGGSLELFDSEKAYAAMQKNHKEPVFAEDLCVAAFVHYDHWNWRAFCFVIDYLKDRRVTVLLSPSEVDATLKKAVSLAEDFVRRFPNDDHAHNERAECYIACGKRNEAKELLMDLVLFMKYDKILCPQSCVTLLDLLMEDGDYDNGLKVARMGQMGTAQTQQTANLGYFVYCEALIMDAKFMEAYAQSGMAALPDDGQEVKWEIRRKDELGDEWESAKKIIQKYELARTLLDGPLGYIQTIVKRTTLLQGLFGPYDEAPERLDDFIKMIDATKGDSLEDFEI